MFDVNLESQLRILGEMKLENFAYNLPKIKLASVHIYLLAEPKGVEQVEFLAKISQAASKINLSVSTINSIDQIPHDPNCPVIIFSFNISLAQPNKNIILHKLPDIAKVIQNQQLKRKIWTELQQLSS